MKTLHLKVSENCGLRVPEANKIKIEKFRHKSGN